MDAAFLALSTTLPAGFFPAIMGMFVLLAFFYALVDDWLDYL